MRENGLGGLSADDALALNWYRKAATSDDWAMYRLGYFYLNGRGGLAEDEFKAFEWFKKGADAGNASAMAHLGVMYRNGEAGLEPDDSVSFEWYQKAAEAGNDWAMRRVGKTYMHRANRASRLTTTKRSIGSTRPRRRVTPMRCPI